MTHWLHTARAGQCRAIVDHGEMHITQHGPIHRLAIICARPAGFASYCAEHVARFRADEIRPPSMPRDRSAIVAPPAPAREPDLMEIIGCD